MCLVSYKPKNIPERRPVPPQILAQTDPPPHESSELWHVLPCSPSAVRASEESSIMTNRKSYTGFPTSHQPRLYATPNVLKIRIKYCQQQTCSAINCLSCGINILARGTSVPLIPESKVTNPRWKHVRCRLKLAPSCPVSGCWPCCFGRGQAGFPM